MSSDWSPGPAWLFCPGDRPDRYLKALAVADMVILDLEDAVAPDRRLTARNALSRLGEEGGVDAERTVLRVNMAGTVDHEDDLALAAELRLPRVMLAKSESVDEVALIDHDVVLLLETPRGIEGAGDLASVANVCGVMWGADDLVAGLGGTSSRHMSAGVAGRYRDIAGFARSRALIAAKSHGRYALDAVHMDIPDVSGLAQECEDAVAVGFDATAAIHPSQVAVIRAAYTPDPERVRWARRLLEHVGPDRGVTTFEGRMVDGPIFKQAERTLRLARAGAGGD